MTDQDLVDGLAKRLKAKIKYDVPFPPPVEGAKGPRTNIESRVVHTTPLDAPGSVWSVLHELGHIHDQRGRNFFEAMIGGGPQTVDGEASAWLFALEHRELDEVGRTVIAFSISSYISNTLNAWGPDALTNAPALKTLIDKVGLDVDWGIAYTAMPEFADKYLDMGIDAWDTAYQTVADNDIANAA